MSQRDRRSNKASDRRDGAGEAEPAATASRRLPYPGMAAPANSSLCGCRAKVKARQSQHTARR
ncbi:hypothetical protein C0U44_07715 (plasmid) [Klebsiella pneumoniae]|nr:hypothetical protein C0U44_07715 [Klebsiella pneumoniae]